MIRTGAQMSYLGYYGDRRSWDAIGYTPYAARPAAGRRCRTTRSRAAAGAARARRRAAATTRSCRLGRGGRDPRLPLRRGGPERAGARARPARRPAGVHRRRGRPVPAALQRGRAPAGDELQPPGAAGHVRRRRHDDQQRALPRPARAGARAVGSSAASTAPRSRRRSARSATWLGVAPIRDEDDDRAPPSGSRRRSASSACPGEFERDGGEHLRAPAAAPATATSAARYGAKQAALDIVLPQAQRRSGSSCSPTCRSSGSSATATRASASPAPEPGERFEVEADEIVSRPARSARAGCSSAAALGGDAVGARAALQHQLAADRRLPGRGRLVRAGSRCRTRTGRPGGSPRYLVETWFNPPATQALAMPGWFDRHFHNMQPLPAHGVRRRARRHHDAGPREGRRATARRSSTRRRTPTARARRGPQGGGPDLAPGRRERVCRRRSRGRSTATPDALDGLAAPDPRPATC